jgi:hypothetical protein
MSWIPLQMLRLENGPSKCLNLGPATARTGDGGGAATGRTRSPTPWTRGTKLALTVTADYHLPTQRLWTSGNHLSALLAVGTRAGVVLLFHLSVATSDDEPGRGARRLHLVGHKKVSSSAILLLAWLPQTILVATDGVEGHHHAAILAVRLPPSMGN